MNVGRRIVGQNDGHPARRGGRQLHGKDVAGPVPVAVLDHIGDGLLEGEVQRLAALFGGPERPAKLVDETGQAGNFRQIVLEEERLAWTLGHRWGKASKPRLAKPVQPQNSVNSGN